MKVGQEQHFGHASMGATWAFLRALWDTQVTAKQVVAYIGGQALSHPAMPLQCSLFVTKEGVLRHSFDGLGA